MLRNTMLRKWDGGRGHLKLKFKLEGSGLEPDWYGASFGLKIFYVRIIIIREKMYENVSFNQCLSLYPVLGPGVKLPLFKQLGE